tara:strand:- start:516 stop:668 length:153 start_codon:yes stop_codon:yes gene_type:complete
VKYPFLSCIALGQFNLVQAAMQAFFVNFYGTQQFMTGHDNLPKYVPLTIK